MELEPGLIVREPMPFGRRVSYDGLFEGRADPLHAILGSSDGGLSGLAGRVAEGTAGDLDAAYARTIGGAIELHEGEVAAGAQSAAGSLLTSGGNVATLHAAVSRYLPSPDAPFDTVFIDPPDGGMVHLGRGFDTPGTQPPPNPRGPDDPGDPGTSHPALVRAQVRRLYLDLLSREPDADGWDHWSGLILNSGWSIDDVRAAILGSDEYHDKHPG